jgi:hypothetical protein
MYGLINVKSSNNISKWQMGFNSAFKGLILNDAWSDGDLKRRQKLVTIVNY